MSNSLLAKRLRELAGDLEADPNRHVHVHQYTHSQPVIDFGGLDMVYTGQSCLITTVNLSDKQHEQIRYILEGGTYED